MEYIIIILLIVTAVLSVRLFLYKRELRRVAAQVDDIMKTESNNLLHSECSIKEVDGIIAKINELIKEIKTCELDYTKKNESMTKMITNISHDLRTPLTSSMGYIDIILNADIDEEEKRRELNIISERLKRLEELINSFFEFSRVISNNESIDMETVNLNGVLEEAIVRYYEDFEKADRKIALDSEGGRVNIISNKAMLMRIFENLIGNALKHSSGNLSVRLGNKDDGKIKIEFENELLYPDLDVEKMFDEFYTVDISRTKGNTGLGLAIAKEFTQQLGGRIYGERVGDRGTAERLIITIEL